MDDSDRKVDLIRVPREEKFYAVEDVLGRDAASVFPTESRKAMLDSEPVKAFLGGNKKFISETELQELKSATGGKGRVEDGSIAADKPLVEVLREQKEAKEAKFQEQWRQMKTGKNRPLDADEYEFLDSIAQAEADRHQQMADQEKEELEEFQKALRNRREAEAAAEAAVDAAAAGAAVVEEAGKGKKDPLIASKVAGKGSGSRARVVVKPRIKTVPKKTQDRREEEDNNDDETKVSKKQKVEEQSEEEGVGLPGLLGGYGSSSSSQ